VLRRVDRVQVVVGDKRATATVFERLLGAEVVREDRVNLLAARRVTLRLGVSEVEVIEPDGAGSAADFLSRTKGGLFAVGLATADVSRLRSHLQARGVSLTEEGGQIFLSPEATGLPGLRAVISPEAERQPAGLVRYLYEATLLVHDFASVVEKAAAGFALEPSQFVPIRSEEFGYEGVLTLFHPDWLDRIEIVTPNDAAKTMGRFFARRRPGFYMCYAEADDLTLIRERLLEYAPDDWTGPRDAVPTNIFIHPKALGGLMLGVSRTSVAWMWSGHPERVLGSPADEHA
jgi:Glyoxalase/Bleomycin resistance protein/Dioxygenase superfamily